MTQRGRLGRRVTPAELSLDATPPFWMPYWQRPLPIVFLYGPWLIFGPAGAPYVPCFVDKPHARMIWNYSWTDLPSGQTFLSFLTCRPNHTHPGVILEYGVEHVATGSVASGANDIGPVGMQFDIIGVLGGQLPINFPTVLGGLFLFFGSPTWWKCASWHEEPT